MTDSALVIEGITAGYGGGDVLHDVSFTVPKGAVTCVVGPNGAGKSTLLSVISGMLRPRAGQVLHGGERLTGKTPREILRAGVVQVPQNHSLFPAMTVAENLELGGYLLGSRATGRQPPDQRRGPLPRYRRLVEEESRQPLRRPAAAGRVRALPDA